MKKSVLQVLSIFICVTTLAACTNNTNDSKQISKPSSRTTKTTDSSTKVTDTDETKKAIKASFDSITIGDLMNSGQGGTSKDDVLKLFGNPNNSFTMPINDISVNQLTWTKNSDITISVQFIEGFTTNKAISGYTSSREATKGLTDFNNIPESAPYDQLLTIFGEPDFYSESLTNGQKIVIVEWMNGLKGSTGATFNAQFTNDVLTVKSQSGLTD